ncbi:MAG: hypothetical protein AAF713_00875 [Pseudomonadota bacterium]
MALVLSILAMTSMPLWFPAGAAGIDHIVFPIVLFPAIWAVAFFYACMDDNIARATVLMTLAVVVQAVLVAFAFVAG